MAYKKVRLGDYLLGYDEINKDGEFSAIDDLQGINNEKYFQGCQSNKNDIDLSRYRICRHGMFAYNKATSRNGEKISIAYRTDGDCLISPSYICFSIKDENVLMPEYLMLWFKRPVFDRYVRFNSWGSATEFFTWEDFQAIEFYLPPIEEQQKIVRQYKTISDRCFVLDAEIKEFYKILENEFRKIRTTIEETEELGVICSYVKEKKDFSAIKSQEYVSTENLLPDKRGIDTFGILEDDSRVTRYQKNDVLISNIRPYFKKIYLCEREGGCNSDVLCFRANNSDMQYLLFSSLYEDRFFDYIMTTVKGTKMPRGDKDDIMKYQIPLLTGKKLDDFNKCAGLIHKLISQYNYEISLLKEIQKKITSRL
mgnify:CR=1 FL=1